MKLKNWVLWLCVAGLLVTEVLLFRANRQKDAALVQSRESQQKVEQLQSDLDQLKTSSVNTLSAENSRLRAENQGLSQKLAQLQSASSELRGQNQKLTRQLDAAHTAVQQQQQQLQQIEQQNQQAAAQPEAPAEPSAATVNQLNACINNLRQIDAAKQEWALENDKTVGAVPPAQDLLPYLQDNLFPVCPAGGVYAINPVGVPPTCSIPGHVLPQ
jgi:predicted RNase H-like nuclease (RuvC/YqgF family)